jgi:AraC-like DNA-binding protein
MKIAGPLTQLSRNMFTQKTIHNLTFTKFKITELPDFVKGITEIRGYGVETTKRLYPRNTPEILINLAKPIRGNVAGKTAVIEECTIQGSKTEFINAWHPEYCHFLSIRFTPNAYYKLLGIPQTSFTDHVIQLEDVINDPSEGLIHRLQEAPDTTQRFRIITKWLKNMVPKTEPGLKLVSDVIINHLNRNPGLTVKQLTEKTGYTRKHLVHRFKEEAGMTIKEYQKINRMYKVLRYIDADSSPSWTKLACDFGFYDQSHFIRDFKNHTGYTPTDYIRPATTQKA